MGEKERETKCEKREPKWRKEQIKRNVEDSQWKNEKVEKRQGKNETERQIK